MDALFAILAAIVGLVGLGESTPATFGVALIGCGCICAALARILQAEKQQKRLLAALDRNTRRTHELMKWLYSLQTKREFQRPPFAAGDTVRVRTIDQYGARIRAVTLWDSIGDGAQPVTKLIGGTTLKILRDRETALEVETIGGRFTGWIDEALINDER